MFGQGGTSVLFESPLELSSLSNDLCTAAGWLRNEQETLRYARL